MPGNNYRINQHSNVGLVQAVNYGDNVFYDSTKADLTPKHVALETHKRLKAEWETSGTCDWLVQDSNFQQWETMEADYSFLWLHGGPGCGKSTLMSRVIESIYQNQFAARGPDAVCLLYFYVGFGNDQEKDKLYRNMLMTFWEQAYRLIEGLNTLVQKLKDGTSGCRLSVAISSRDYKGIDQLRAHKLVQIEVTVERNKRDIETYLEKNLESAFLQRRPELRKQVFNELNKKADGMFLWVSLQALNICNMELELQVSNALRSLVPPQKLQDLYRTYADGFESLEDPIRQQIVQRTAALLADSTGSMSKEVILVALSLDANGKIDQVLHQGLTEDPATIIRFSNHLVRFNENLGVFQFCHTTVFEFFRQYRPAMYNHRIAKLCLSHLCSPEFSQGPRSDATWYNPGSLGLILQKHPFLLFASSTWATSIKKSFGPEDKVSVEESHSAVLDLLKILFDNNKATEEGNLRLAFQVYFLNMGKTLPGGVCHEHIVSYFGLVRFFDTFRARKWFDLTRLDSDGLRPIHWAVRNEIDLEDAARTVEKLIEYGADINATDKEGRTPYTTHAKLDLTNKVKETALIAACRKHHEKVVLHLVEAGADVKIQSSFGTALQTISLIGCCDCANAILDCYGESRIIENDGPFGTSLHAAAFHGHSKLVKLLCSKRMNLRATHRTYGSPVTAAAAGFNPGLDSTPFLETIQELIEHGVNVNDRSGIVGPALRAAAYHGSPKVVRLLLDKGAKVRKAKGPMGTAYEAADDRGHQEIKEILLKSDVKAADYGGAPVPKWHDRQQIQRKVFRATVKASSMDTINSLVNQFEKFIEGEIKKGETPFLRELVKLAKDAFQDVIKLATKSRANTNTSTKRQDNGGRSRLRGFMSSFCCMGLAGKDGESISGVRLDSVTSHHLRRTTTTFVQDGLGEHLPQVLDRLTQAAVKILGDAIASQNKHVIRLIASTWVGVLNNLVSYPSLGEPMLEVVVQKRANELKEHLTNQDLSPEERFRKAETLALVGIELLVMAVGRGQKFRHLSFVISRLWIKAVTDVEDLGKEGEAPVRELIRIFVERFLQAVMIQDQVNAEVHEQAGIELLRAAALSPKTMLLDKFSEGWVPVLGLALERNMKYMAEEVISLRWEEYQRCFKDKEHDKALGLALAGMGVLRTAIKQRNGPAASALQPFIESGFRLARETHADRDASPGGVIQVQDLGAIFDAVVSLFATAEETQPNCLNTLASKIVDLAGVASGNCHQVFIGVINQRVEEAGRIVDSPERERQLIQISRTILIFLDIAMCAEERNPAVLSALKGVALGSLAGVLPNFTEMGELARYTKAIEYLYLED
ncbi:Ankyrin repeat domain-containing 50-like protein [Cladobotryum mycophilum]|uniref:Ankyrin repeat domain-containing 50-like protein n=1 Tax=Cladobotryum mycophilum TaxID=491253 RepID=A0ABR0SLP6_9HYPO